MSRAHEDHEPEDVQEVVRRLRENRAQLEPIELDRIKTRVMARARPPQAGGATLGGRITVALLTLGLVGAGAGGVMAGSGGPTGGSSSATAQGEPGTCTAAGEAPNFRWHYSANGTSGSWSGTQTGPCPGSISMGPQAMEGDLKVSPGTILKAGYDFTVPGNASTFSITVTNPQVVFTVRCVSGAAPSSSTFTVTMPTQTYTVTDQSWYPSGDQSSSLVYQGSTAVPDLCGGGELRLDQGGTFSASLS